MSRVGYDVVMDPCVRCGEPVSRRGTRGPVSKYCSDTCRERSKVRSSQPGYIKRRDSLRRRNADARPDRPCVICGDLIPKTYTVRKKTCGSDKCDKALAAKGAAEWRRKYTEETGENYFSRFPDSRKSGAARRKARLRSVEIVEIFKNAEIFDRDRWICQLCFEPVDSTTKAPDRMSPSLDHIVPVSLGGNHTRDNVRLAHYGCNASRGNRVDVA